MVFPRHRIYSGGRARLNILSCGHEFGAVTNDQRFRARIDFVDQMIVPYASRCAAQRRPRPSTTNRGLKLVLDACIGRWRHRRARRVETSHAEIAIDCIGPGSSHVLDVITGGGGVVRRDLHGRIADDDVSTNRVPLDSSGEMYPICIPHDLIVLDRVIGISGRHETDAEIIPLSCVSISANPVQTEPVVACASGQSYAAAGIADVPI